MNPALQQLIDQITAAIGAQNSATTLINGFNGRVTNAVNQALANGATAAQLQPVIDELTAFKASTDALAAAVAANPGT